MVFAHDTEVSLTTAAALVNTAPPAAPGHRREGVDQLATTGDLDAFVEEWDYTGSRTHDAAELDAVRALRPQLRRLWTGDEEEQVTGVNDLLARARALPQLVRHDGWDWHLHATTPDAPLAERMAVEAAMALVDVLRSGERSRLRTCAAEDCDDVLVDLSRNRSKRFCDGGCGNRAAAAAYRARVADRG
ncbi:CGNR zinc finger domain-containing protein [Pseudokineococcus marinus]|uniref:CGNR zinc finger domain-containing protein n=1 Tax=Pseudokineococcus marinus TaxID=351215 RepID=A0A849BZX0_9ACTN|nr:CGNR zinc finger domain-containing protein [Pseudokineococcus marinus]NNH23008.1 CGNR zinc finger domain-containing protein [Pseudokineococcus marinus]